VQMARLGKEFTDCFSSAECIQANLTDPDSVARAFKDPEGDYNIVINLAGETKLSQSEEVYSQGIVKLSSNCIREAAKHKTEKFIEVSTAEVYEPSDSAATEASATKPWTGIAKAKLKVEEELKATKGLPWVIVRPAITYGQGDIRGLSSRLCIAAVYKMTGEKMEFPQWFEQQKINAVHVSDVAKALWHLALHAPPSSIYNLAGKDNLDTKKLNSFLEKLFGIQTSPLSTIKSEAIKLMPMESILEEINGQTLPNWLKLVKESKLDYSPMSPYLELEQISSKNLCIDGSKIEKTSFSYEHPAVTEEELKIQLGYAVAEGWFPKNMTK